MVNKSISIYLNKRTREILLVNKLYGTIGTLTGWFERGNLLRYKANEFKEQGWDMVLQVIENQLAFDPNDKSELDQMSSAKQSKFDREHKCVGLYFDSSGEIYLVPFKKESGGGVGKEKIILGSPITNEPFWEKLMEAFEKSD